MGFRPPKTIGVALTGAQIKTLLFAEADTNNFDDAAQAKLSGIESNATADQTASEIEALYEGLADTNKFTDSEKTKLAGVETGADVTDASNVDAAGALMHTDLSQNGVVARTGAESYTGRTLQVAAPLSLANPDGVAGDPSFTFDLDGLTEDSSPAEATSHVIVRLNNGTHVKVLLSDLPSAGSGIGNVVEDTSPQLGGNLDANDHYILFDDAHGIRDDNSNDLLIFQRVASAVNYAELSNAATGTGPLLAVAGDDTNIDLRLNAKGSGQIKALTDLDVAGSLTVSGTVDGRDVAADGSKLDGVEVGAEANPTDAEIKAAYENNADTNAFTDNEKTKLAGVESGAAADQTGAEIKTLLFAETDTNNFDDADQAKLDGIEAGATGDQTGAEMVSAIDTELGQSDWKTAAFPFEADDDALRDRNDFSAPVFVSSLDSWFEWDPNETITNDGVNVIGSNHDTGAGRWVRTRPKNEVHLQLPEGATGHVSDVQAWVDKFEAAGGPWRITLGPGIWNWNGGPLNLNSDDCSIEGSGSQWGGTTLQTTDNANEFFAVGGTTPVNKFRISGVSLSKAAATSRVSAPALNFLDCQNGVIDDMFVSGIDDFARLGQTPTGDIEADSNNRVGAANRIYFVDVRGSFAENTTNEVGDFLDVRDCAGIRVDRCNIGLVENQDLTRGSVCKFLLTDCFVDTFVVENSSFNRFWRGVTANCQGTNHVWNTWFDNVIFDNCVEEPVLIHAQNTFRIYRWLFEHCWLNAHNTRAALLKVSGSGEVSEIVFSSPLITQYGDRSNGAMQFEDGVGNVFLYSPRISNNLRNQKLWDSGDTSGAVSAQASYGLIRTGADFTGIYGGVIGERQNGLNRTEHAWGVQILDADKDYAIVGVHFQQFNQLPYLEHSSNTTGSGGRKCSGNSASDFTGALPDMWALQDVAIKSSGSTYQNNTNREQRWKILGGTVTSVLVNGSSASTTQGFYDVPAGGDITISYSSAPNLIQRMGWSFGLTGDEIMNLSGRPSMLAVSDPTALTNLRVDDVNQPFMPHVCPFMPGVGVKGFFSDPNVTPSVQPYYTDW